MAHIKKIFLKGGGIYLERNTLHREWAISEGDRPRNMAWLVLGFG